MPLRMVLVLLFLAGCRDDVPSDSMDESDPSVIYQAEPPEEVDLSGWKKLPNFEPYGEEVLIIDLVRIDIPVECAPPVVDMLILLLEEQGIPVIVNPTVPEGCAPLFEETEEFGELL